MTSKRSSDSELPRFPVILGKCLGHKAFRGFGPLKALAEISQADVFDQNKNRSGTQRNLSVQHARKAYQYVAEKQHAFCPLSGQLKSGQRWSGQNRPTDGAGTWCF